MRSLPWGWLSVPVLLLISGCFSSSPAPTAPAPRASVVRFSELKTTVLAAKCLRCHAEYGSEKGLASEIVPGHPEQSELYQSVATGRMPERGNPLPKAQIELVRNYIEHVTWSELSAPMIDLKNVTYRKLSSAIFGPRCVKCHANYRTEAGVLADIEPGDPEHSILYNYVANGAMPTQGYRYVTGSRNSKEAGPLSQNNISAIRAFIESLPPRKYPPIAPTWSSLRANLFQRSCVSCHSPGGSGEDNPLVTYGEVSALSEPISERIQSSVQRMPAAHTTFPPRPELIRAFVEWVKAGKPR